MTVLGDRQSQDFGAGVQWYVPDGLYTFVDVLCCGIPGQIVATGLDAKNKSKVNSLTSTSRYPAYFINLIPKAIYNFVYPNWSNLSDRRMAYITQSKEGFAFLMSLVIRLMY